MSRTDRALLALLLPLAVLTLGAHIREVIRSGLQEPAFYTAQPNSSDGYPRVTGFRMDFTAATSGLEIGDRLILIGDVDLHQRGHLGVDAVALEEAAADGSVDVVFERAGKIRSSREMLAVPSVPWVRIPTLLAMILVCVIVLIRAPPGPATRLFFVTFMVGVIFQAQFHGPSFLQTVVSKSMFYALGAIAPALIVFWALHFPPELPKPPRSIALLPWLVISPLFGLLRLSYLLGGPVPPALVPRGISFAHAVFAVGLLAAVTWNYSRSGPVGRRRLKWIMLGAWMAMMPMLLLGIAAQTPLGRGWYGDVVDWTKVAMVTVPLSFLLAMQRQGLFDVNRVIGATATYTILLLLFASGVSFLVPTAAAASSRLLGLPSASTQIALTTALVIGLVPMQSLVRPWIDRWFFVDQVVAETEVKRLLLELDEERDVNNLWRRCGEGLERAFHPKTSAAYAAVPGRGYDPAWRSAEADPRSLSEADPVVSVLRATESRTLVRDRSRRRGSGTLSPLEKAALEMLDADVVAAIRTPQGMPGFLCLGARSSGDIYTGTDSMLLESVTDRMALRWMDDRAQSLGRYVPEAVRSGIGTRGRLEASEREVSVLFVDIRGFTSMSSGHRPGEVFDAVSRYTTRVSEIILLFQGQVLEFHGDGLLAVFGAPEALADKERAAVRAARAIVESLAEEAAGVLASEGAGFEVGVGIATGLAFVGNIQAVDRWIWTAIGSTLNLASRLQSLTRDVGAAIVIDDLTCRRAADLTSDFVGHPGTEIRGFPEPLTVHSLPITSCSRK